MMSEDVGTNCSLLCLTFYISHPISDVTNKSSLFLFLYSSPLFPLFPFSLSFPLSKTFQTLDDVTNYFTLMTSQSRCVPAQNYI